MQTAVVHFHIIYTSLSLLSLRRETILNFDNKICANLLNRVLTSENQVLENVITDQLIMCILSCKAVGFTSLSQGLK